MFKNHELDNIECIVEQLIQIVNNVHIAKARADLERLCITKNKVHKDIIDIILSSTLQYKQKIPVARYNMLKPEASDLTIVDSLLTKFSSEVFYKLPFILQRLFMLSVNKKYYRLNDGKLRRLVTRWYDIPQEVALDNKCKRCYNSSSDILCDTCKTKIETCAEYHCTSFTVTGTTIEPFEYNFKDWSVKVTNYGEYTFTKLDKSISKTYQPKLPFIDYQNNLNLIG